MNQKSESVCGESEVRRIVSAENGNGKTEAKIGSEANRKRAKIGAAKRKRRSEARRGERIKRESNAVLKAFNTDEKQKVIAEKRTAKRCYADLQPFFLIFPR